MMPSPQEPAAPQTKSRLQKIQKELARVDEEILQGQVRAPFSGTVQKVFVGAGESVSPQDVLVVVQPTSTYEVISTVAEKLGDKLVVVINNDNWIKLKKGHGFMKASERAEIISAFRDVDRVVISGHKKNNSSPSRRSWILRQRLF
jgi:acetyl/propionyl-CoA carboxylase alpha subunit